MQSKSPEVHTPQELPITPETPPGDQFPKTPDGSPKEGFVPATPLSFVDEKPGRLGNTWSQAASTSNNGATSARALPLIPKGTIWNRAQGLIQPVFAHLKTYEELRAVVDKCTHPNVKTFHTAFDLLLTLKTRGRETENSVCWDDVYAKYIFMACEYFYPRLHYVGATSGFPYLFEVQLSRDEAISCILSFLTGQVMDKKTVTSRMQHMKGTFAKAPVNKKTIDRIWDPIEESYLGKATATPRRATHSAGNHVLHPFLGYLLGLNDSFFDDPATAFAQPAMDVSHVEAPTEFRDVWDVRREELRLKDEASKSNSAKKRAATAGSSVLHTPTPARPAIKRKRSAEVSTPSKKRVGFAPEAVSKSAYRGNKIQKNARAPVRPSHDDETDELDSSEYGDHDTEDSDDMEDSRDGDSEDFVSVASGTPTPAPGRAQAFVSTRYPESSSGPESSSMWQALLSAAPSTSDNHSSVVDDHSDDITSESSVDIVLDVASSHSFDMSPQLPTHGEWERGMTWREVEAVNALLDFGMRWRVFLGPECDTE